MIIPTPTVLTALAKDDGESNLQRWSSVIGIVTAIVGNILISFALNIQRYAHIRLSREQKAISAKAGNQTDENAGRADEFADPQETDPLIQSSHSRSSSESQATIRPSEKENQPPPKTYLKSPYWWAGIVLMTVGEAGNFLAYGFAPASIVSPLGVVALISNCVIAPIMLKEPFRQRDFWGVMVAVGGAVTVVLSAKQEETKLGPGAIWHAITRWEFEAYFGITVAMIIVLMWASTKYGERTILIDLGLVGLFGGYTVLSTKGVASLLSYTFWRVVTFPVTYLLVAILIGTALMQIKYINRALQRFDSTQVIPTQFVLFTISVIVGSSILYRDFQSAGGDRLAKFIGGCALTFLGVYLITSGRERKGDEEEAMGLTEGYEDELATNAQDEASRPPSTGSSTPKRLHTPASASKTASLHSVTDSSFPMDPSRLDNPWRSSDMTPTFKRLQPPLQTTTSSPVLPSEALHDRPVTPAALTHATPRTGFSTLSRKSFSKMMPATFVSPLSSSLSAVVADELRRSQDHSPIKPRTNRSHSTGLRKTQSHRNRSRAPSIVSTLPSQDDHHDHDHAVHDGESDTPPQSSAGKGRSLSATFGGFLKRAESAKRNEAEQENPSDA